MDGGNTIAPTARKSDDYEICGDALLQGGLDLTRAASRGRRWPVRQILTGLAALIVLAGAGYYGHYYWTTGRYLVSTDDATVDADSVIISPKVSGYLGEVAVQDNQSVHTGQILARIEDPDYRTALAGARANVDSARANRSACESFWWTSGLSATDATHSVIG